MQSLHKYNKGIKYLLRAIDLFRKYVWVVPLKDLRGISIVNAFQKIISKKKKKEMLTQVSIKISKISYFSFTFRLNEKYC